MQGLNFFRISSAAVRRTVGVTVVSTVTLLGVACGGKGAASGPMAGPPVAAQPMPPIPDLSQVRTFTRPIPGLPTDKTGMTNAALQQLGDLKFPETAWNQGAPGVGRLRFRGGGRRPGGSQVRPAGQGLRRRLRQAGGGCGSRGPLLTRNHERGRGALAGPATHLLLAGPGQPAALTGTRP